MTQQTEEGRVSDVPKPVVATAADGVSRRRLIRAGLSAAPVVAALKSNSVLAGGTGTQCVKPSAFASLKNANFDHSRWDATNMNCSCVRPQDWCHRDYKCKDHKLSKHTMYNKSQVHVTCWSGSTLIDKPDLTFNEIFNRNDLGADKQFARYVAACYANAVEYGDWNSPLTKSECLAIWRTAGSGWTPVSGGKSWSRSDTDLFFRMLFPNG